MLTDIIQSLGQQSRPAKIQHYRKKYTDYRIKTETEGGEPVESFNEWLVRQGVDPAQLLFE